MVDVPRHTRQDCYGWVRATTLSVLLGVQFNSVAV